MTNSKKNLILITNDDGVYASGINKLIEAIAPLGEVVVVAPDKPRSGMSGAITCANPIRVSLLKDDEKDLKIYACTGTPVDCVKIGTDRLLPRKPDLLVSGINHGSNAAVSVIYSGTVGAAIEGCIIGIPSLAVSLTDNSPHADFGEAAKFGKSIAEKILKEGLPKGICLNLNVPNIPKVKGLKVGSQTAGRWTKEFEEMKDPSGKSVYWLTGDFLNDEPDNVNSDEWALANGYAALVPLYIDMTAYGFIEKIKNWEKIAGF
ncbi:MAG: 5'/3'-nucleotidase SurE [Dysgonamonadaceae bacterium]|jgi:5'-nucleotidase|nr:5'/3'-nucleotidase SurE [Dysgonamonadaceae bacterium]